MGRGATKWKNRRSEIMGGYGGLKVQFLLCSPKFLLCSPSFFSAHPVSSLLTQISSLLTQFLLCSPKFLLCSPKFLLCSPSFFSAHPNFFSAHPNFSTWKSPGYLVAMVTTHRLDLQEIISTWVVSFLVSRVEA